MQAITAGVCMLSSYPDSTKSMRTAMAGTVANRFGVLWAKPSGVATVRLADPKWASLVVKRRTCYKPQNPEKVKVMNKKIAQK